jgi:hypothetical protein
MNHLYSGLRRMESIKYDVMVDPRIKDLNCTEIIRAASRERRQN